MLRNVKFAKIQKTPSNAVDSLSVKGILWIVTALPMITNGSIMMMEKDGVKKAVTHEGN